MPVLFCSDYFVNYNKFVFERNTLPQSRAAVAVSLADESCII